MTNIHTIAAAIALSLASAAACDPADATAGNAELAAAQEIIAVEHLAEQSFDAGDIDVHMGLWAEGAIEFTSPFGSFTAADEYEAWLAGFFDYTQQMGGTRHHVINPIVQLTDDGESKTSSASAASAVLPTPLSPVTTATPPQPSAAAVSASRSRVSSAVRP